VRALQWLLPVALFLFLQLMLRWAIDLSDLPGAAGTWSLYLCAKGQFRGDAAAGLYHWLQTQFDIGLLDAARLGSALAGIGMVAGAMLAGWGLAGRDGAIGAGFLGACWSMTHFYSMMIGNDPLAVGLGWLAAGLVWAGVSGGPARWPLAMAGVALVPAAVAVKELALPTAAAAAIGIALLKPGKRLLVSVPLIGYCAYWGYAWMWPDESTRLQMLPDLNPTGLQRGWLRLVEFYERGIPEAKLDQLLVAGIALTLISKQRRWRRLYVGAAGAVLLCFTAYLLEGRARPRYVSPAALASLAAVGAGLVAAGRRMRSGAYWTVFLPLAAVSGMLVLDGWSYFHVWSEKREDIVGSSPSRLPQPPDMWRAQYTGMPDIVFRDLTLYGGAELARFVETGKGLATTRLRDERHRSLAAYSAIEGAPFVVLDPGRCCTGQPVDIRCAERTVRALAEAGISTALPKDIEGVERIYSHEQRWLELLRVAAAEVGEQEDGRMWLMVPQQGQNGSELPCQGEIPFRSPK
jgi:hypothetical protein